MSSAEPYKIRLITSGTTNQDKQIVVPLGNTFDGVGQNELIEDYVGELAEDAINPIVDYEMMRYQPVDTSGNIEDNMDYEFYFYGRPVDIDYNYKNIYYPRSANSNRITYNSPRTWGLMAWYTIPAAGGFTYYNGNPANINHKITFRVDINMDYADTTGNMTLQQVANDFGPTTLRTSYAAGGQPLQPPYGNTTGGYVANPAINESITAGNVIYMLSTMSLISFPVNAKWYRRTFTITTTYDSSLAIPGTTFNNIISPGQQLELKVTTDNPNTNGVFWGVSCGATCSNHNASWSFRVDYLGTSSPPTPGYYTRYLATDIPQVYSENNFKGYTQSFFRLDFWDSVLGESQNLLFTDIMTVSEGRIAANAEFINTFGGQNYFLYWLKNDPIIEENGFRDVWMTVRFFNSVTGQIHQFLNVGTALGSTNNRPTIDQYETILKYTKVRLFANHTYMICKRYVNPFTLTQSTTNPLLYIMTLGWTTVEDQNVGVNNLPLYQISIKS